MQNMLIGSRSSKIKNKNFKDKFLHIYQRNVIVKNKLINLYFKFTVNKIMNASVVYWSEFLPTDPEVRVRFPALPDFLRSSGSGTGSNQPREYN
jgi:hypothetical protein